MARNRLIVILTRLQAPALLAMYDEDLKEAIEKQRLLRKKKKIKANMTGNGVGDGSR